MSGSVYFEGNGYFDSSILINSSIGNSAISGSAITTTSIDMDLQNITNVKDPVQPQDAATKQYVDNLEVVFSNITLTGTASSLISSNLKGSYIISINNQILNGPSGIFHVTKSESGRHAHIVRTVATPGLSSNVTLNITWPIGSGILLSKNGSVYDGSYRVKIM